MDKELCIETLRHLRNALRRKCHEILQKTIVFCSLTITLHKCRSINPHQLVIINQPRILLTSITAKKSTPLAQPCACEFLMKFYKYPMLTSPSCGLQSLQAQSIFESLLQVRLNSAPLSTTNSPPLTCPRGVSIVISPATKHKTYSSCKLKNGFFL